MSQSNAESRHSIQVVANRTGLSPDLIRAWERRYEAVNPARSGTRRRLYSDGDIERLMLLRRATRSGRRIGDVAHLGLDELSSMLEEDRRVGTRRDEAVSARGFSREAERYLDRCLEAVRALDGRELEARLRRAVTELDLESAFEGVLTPLLRHVGEGWLRGTLSIVHEHMTTTVVRSLLDSLRASFTAPASAPALIATTPVGQYHELGALMTAVAASVEGWRAIYLGCDLPADEIASAAGNLGARAVALSIVYPDQEGALEAQLQSLGRLLRPPARVIAGGRAARQYGALLAGIGALVCEDLAGLRRELRWLAGSAGPGVRGSSRD